MRLVRELLAADAEPALAGLDAGRRSARYLEVVTGGLALRSAAILVHDPTSGALRAVASTLPPVASALLADPAGRTAALARRAFDERRAFLARHRGSDELLVRALHDADPAVETIAVLPLAERSAVGVLVLAGDERTLAADVVRTLHPALRVLAMLLAPHRDGTARGPESLEADMLRLERDAQARTIASLEAHVAELEAALAAARAAAIRAPAPTPHVGAVRAEPTIEDAPTVEPEEATPTILVVDVAAEWPRPAGPDQRLVVVEPSPATPTRVREERPSRIVVNVAAPGALAQTLALRAEGIATPVFGVLARPGTDRVVGLGMLEAVAHPLSVDALVAAVERTAPRGARIFAAGRNADALMKMRQRLAKQGLSVSMARDTKQIDELLAMVRPQLVVIDLDLPMRQGYELVVRMAATTPVPALVLLVPEGDPAPVLRQKLDERLAAGTSVRAAQWLAEVVRQKLPAKTVVRPSAAAAATR
jgi:CheY-like chemotaxis protein